MFHAVNRWLLVCCVIGITQSAYAASNLAVFLKNFYTDYEVVKQCSGQAQLTPSDVETAKTAMAAIEKHYLQRDASLDKGRLQQEAVANKNAGFKMVNTTRKVDLGQYCRVSLNELVGKEREIDGAGTAK